MTQLERIDWDDGLIQRLTELHARGYSSREIALQMGDEFVGLKFTRNSIIGKRHRLCLPHRALPIVQPKPKQIRNRKRGPYRKRKGAAGPRGIEMKPKEPRAEPGGPLTIYQLGPDNCRFPLGNFPFVFCGKQQAEGSSYCLGHYLLTHHPVQRREHTVVQIKAWA